MAWEIVTKAQTAKYCRVPENFLDDLWYELALGELEYFTGWYSLTAAESKTGYFDGNGSSILKPEYVPINSLTMLQISGVTVPSSMYHVAWNSIQLNTYRPGETYETTVFLERTTSFGTVFPSGIKNVYLNYNVGGITSLPASYRSNVKLSLLMVIKEFTAIPRTEGSDYVVSGYRPDRTLNPEEVLVQYGIHGKIDGILKRFLPKKKIYL